MASGQQLSGDEASSGTTDRAERLKYLADMVSELQDIASREGCVTLAGLLALAHVEAQQRAKERVS